MHDGAILPGAGDGGEALGHEARHAAALANRGMVLMALQQSDDAVRSYQASLQWRPGHVETLVNLGIAQQSRHDHEAALGSTNRMLIEEDRRSVREKLELLAAFVDPAKRLVRDPTQPLYDSDIDEFRAALDKFERSGLVL